jgi:hypothetical protein
VAGEADWEGGVSAKAFTIFCLIRRHGHAHLFVSVINLVCSRLTNGVQ